MQKPINTNPGDSSVERKPLDSSSLGAEDLATPEPITLVLNREQAIALEDLMAWWLDSDPVHDLPLLGQSYGRAGINADAISDIEAVLWNMLNPKLYKAIHEISEFVNPRNIMETNDPSKLPYSISVDREDEQIPVIIIHQDGQEALYLTVEDAERLAIELAEVVKKLS